MRGLARVCRCVAPGRLVAAADVPAGDAPAQVDPAATGREALDASVGDGDRVDVELVEVTAGFGHVAHRRWSDAPGPADCR